MITAEDFLGLTPQEAQAAAGDETVRICVYRSPKGEMAGEYMRVVRAEREGGAWILTVCGFPMPLSV